MCLTFKSFIKFKIYTISHVVFAIERYSASAEDRNTVCCFLDFHDMSDDLTKIQYHVRDLRVSGQMPQSASEKVFT